MNEWMHNLYSNIVPIKARPQYPGLGLLDRLGEEESKATEVSVGSWDCW